MLASGVGGAAGVVPARIIGTAMGEAVLGAVALGGVLGTIATAQWLIMRRRLSWAARWAMAKIAGGLVGGAVALGLLDALSANGSETLGAVLGTLAGLAAFGTVQWLILRRVAHAGGWVAASVAGLVAAGPLGVGVLGSLVGDGGGFGVVYGAITGARFVSVISKRPASAPDA
ncbi:MAG: hypothetical protein OXJ54_16125 [Gemmatimonadetes bacterium]|nr:hypothetical protein [Candidatus Palauibacter rhopaloidicola]